MYPKCCQQSSKEDIEANWLLVSDATSTSGGGDWEVVSDLQCLNVSKEKREEMEKVFDFTPLEEWLGRLWNGKGGKARGLPGRCSRTSRARSVTSSPWPASSSCRWRRRLASPS